MKRHGVFGGLLLALSYGCGGDGPLPPTPPPKQVVFAAPHDYPTGAGATALVLADLNGDAAPDLVVANHDASTISLLVNAGDGTYLPADNYDAPMAPSSLVLLDSDGDGDGDLVVGKDVINGVQSEISIFLNRGAILSHSSDTTVDGGEGTMAVAAADLDGDGVDDLVVGTNHRLSTLRGGRGTFGPSVAYDLLNQKPYGVSTGDLDGDGRPDILLASDNGGVIVLLNNGTGKLGAAVDWSGGKTANVISTAIADLDNDGAFDLIVANAGSLPSVLPGSVGVLMNRGGGRFGPEVNHNIDDAVDSVAAADFNGDGRTDIVFTELYAGKAGFLLNDGAGGFAATVDYPTAAGARAVAAGDVDGDGKVDVVVANWVSGSVTVLLNQTP